MVTFEISRKADESKGHRKMIKSLIEKLGLSKLRCRFQDGAVKI